MCFYFKAHLSKEKSVQTKIKQIHGGYLKLQISNIFYWPILEAQHLPTFFFF